MQTSETVLFNHHGLILLNGRPSQICVHQRPLKREKPRILIVF